MAGISFNTEAKDNLKRVGGIMEDAKASLKKGITNSVELAESTGAAKYIASAHNMEEAGNALLVSMDEVVEVFAKLVKHYENVESALM